MSQNSDTKVEIKNSLFKELELLGVKYDGRFVTFEFQYDKNILNSSRGVLVPQIYQNYVCMSYIEHISSNHIEIIEDNSTGIITFILK